MTHTLAYTIWGVLHSGLALDRPDAVAAARRAARAVAGRVEADGWLPGMLDANWSGQARYACLTGNAQMALVWLRLDALDPEPALVRAADRVIELVGAAQSLGNPDPGIRGGIPGSDPIMGDYVRGGLPNWAAKFTIDALLARERSAGRLGGPVVTVARGSRPDRCVPTERVPGRALVTGGAGFIGSHLVARLLDHGDEVLIVDDLSTGSAARVPAGARLEACDVSSAAVERVVAGVATDGRLPPRRAVERGGLGP